MKLIVEKPFGTSLETAEELAQVLFEHVPKESVQLVDHYMGKRGLNAIREFKQVNTFPSKIKRVDVVMVERETVQKRTGFYEGVGVIRDTMQNHLMMMLALLCSKLSDGPETQARLDFFRSLAPIDIKNVIFLGQYESYKTHLVEDGVINSISSVSNTPTFTSLFFGLKQHVKSQFLADDVRINFISGKAVNTRTAFISCALENGDELSFSLQGDNEFISGAGLAIKSNNISLYNMPKSWRKEHSSSDSIILRFDSKGAKIPEAYEVLLRAALEQKKEYFVSLEEVLQSWRIFNDIVISMDSGNLNLRSYSIGADYHDFLFQHVSKEDL